MAKQGHDPDDREHMRLIHALRLLQAKHTSIAAKARRSIDVS